MSKKKILVVDDEPDILRALKSRLQANHYEVVTAEDGKTALSVLESFDADLIILDILMPEMNGYEICKKLKEMEKTRDIPVIVITASQHTDLAEKCLEAGVSDFVRKPLDPRRMLEVVDRWTKNGEERGPG